MSNGPVQSFGFVEDLPKKKVAKKVKLEDTYSELIQRLQTSPGKWAKLVTGKTVTISRTRARLDEVFAKNGYEFATRAGEAEKTSELYGRWVKPAEDTLGIFS